MLLSGIHCINTALLTPVPVIYARERKWSGTQPRNIIDKNALHFSIHCAFCKVYWTNLRTETQRGNEKRLGHTQQRPLVGIDPAVLQLCRAELQAQCHKWALTWQVDLIGEKSSGRWIHDDHNRGSHQWAAIRHWNRMYPSALWRSAVALIISREELLKDSC